MTFPSIFTRQTSLADDIASRNKVQCAIDSYTAIVDQFGPDLLPSMKEDVIQQFSQALSAARLHQLSNEFARRADALERGDVVQRVRRAGE